MTFDELLQQAAAGTLKGSTFRGTQSTPDTSLAAPAVADADAMLFDPLDDVLRDAEIRGILHPALSNGRDPLVLILEAEEQGHFSFHDYIIGA